MSKTVADASRDYRQRQRAKLERYEAALQRIVSVLDDPPFAEDIWVEMVAIAEDALKDG